MDYFMVHVPGTKTQEMHRDWGAAHREADRIARHTGKSVTVLRQDHTVEPPEPELSDQPIDAVLGKLAKDNTLIAGVLYGMLAQKKSQGVAHVPLRLRTEDRPPL